MAINLDDRARAVLEGLRKLLKDELRKNLLKKGRKDTGKLHDSIEVELKQATNSIMLQGSFEDYGTYQDTGTRAGKLRNIDALEEWVRRKLGAPADKSRGIAFAISKTHAKVGMHSKNGRANPSGKGWMTEVLDSNEGEIFKRIDEAFAIQVNVTIDNIINDF